MERERVDHQPNTLPQAERHWAHYEAPELTARQAIFCGTFSQNRRVGYGKNILKDCLTVEADPKAIAALVLSRLGAP
jgi:hypothetical protein